MRIHIMGSAGSGKTTLASQLAQQFSCPHIELDAIHWGPYWQAAETEQFRDDVADALSGDKWVVDGNYSKVRDIVWHHVQTVVWLDYPLSILLWRLFNRSIRRIVTKEALWEAGNRETIRGQFFDSNSLIPYTIKTHKSRREKIEALSQQPAYAHIDFVRLRSPKAAKNWSTNFNPQTGTNPCQPQPTKLVTGSTN